ncbi:methylamine utilization protein MauJ [Bradyrhizobium sp. 31Argb]|uniref:methylamine utilization protein MauJ n=1 Tax=Bradyrhizobium sp. 31Argb TaxID=3141247 RepID=UPI003749F559
MYAKRFESLLTEQIGQTGLSSRAPDEMSLRFESLRGYGLLPSGRVKNVTPLSPSQMAATILATVTAKPGFAGLAGKTLSNLRPVGGAEASFAQCATLGNAVEALLQNPTALDSFLELRVSDSEIYTNAHGRGAIVYRSGDEIVTCHYVHQNALSLFHAGAEKDFDPRAVISSTVTETVFYAGLFRKIVNELAREATTRLAPPVIDPMDDDEETRKEERTKRLGILRNSTFLNLAVDTQVTWPPVETLVHFEGYRLILMPPTREHTTSVHIDLVGQGITSENSVSLINRLLSLMAWCDDNFAILQEGWSGNPVPAPVPKQNLGFATAYHWIFDRQLPSSREARKALALYREGRNAEQNYFISYAILSYYKIIELKFGDFEGQKVRDWIAVNYAALKTEQMLADRVADFERERGNEEPQKYLNKACRVAVAHSSINNPSDPDELPELRRLHVAAHILRALARRFISQELGISECPYDGS